MGQVLRSGADLHEKQGTAVSWGGGHGDGGKSRPCQYREGEQKPDLCIIYTRKQEGEQSYEL